MKLAKFLCSEHLIDESFTKIAIFNWKNKHKILLSYYLVIIIEFKCFDFFKR